MNHDVEVFARQRWNDTGIDVLKGQHIQIESTGSWIDSTIMSTPDGFERPWLDPVGWTRRVPKARWFELIAVIGQMKRPCYTIGSKGAFVADNDGRLYLYANDAWLFYFNNKGSIRATIDIGSQ